MLAHNQGLSLHQRLNILQKFRHQLSKQPLLLAHAVERPLGEVLASEILPLLDACRFLESEAPKLLAPRSVTGPRLPLYRNLKIESRRLPRGRILIIAPFNYPLFLPGVQALQAWVAGNQVIWKPGRLGKAVACALRDALIASGMPSDSWRVLDESIFAAQQALSEKPNYVIFTGSASSARAVAQQCAQELIPCCIEASGSDSVFVTPSADLQRVAKALRFGLEINSGQTCISPRRVFVTKQELSNLEKEILLLDPIALNTPITSQAKTLAQDLIQDAIQSGAKLLIGSVEANTACVLTPLSPTSRFCSSDVFAPILGLIPVNSMEEAIHLEKQCPYSLGSSIFGNEDDCRDLLDKLDTPNVCLNDLIAPTADPRVSFGGRDESGYGKTRGAHGLLSCTIEQQILNRRGGFLPHLIPHHLENFSFFIDLIQFLHSRGIVKRFGALTKVMKFMNKK